jgi:hypothetical protein
MIHGEINKVGSRVARNLSVSEGKLLVIRSASEKPINSKPRMIIVIRVERFMFLQKVE